ncbi:sigma-54-dependent Fis family transcriptional regulator [Mucilaginibacter sp. SJ]|uniref:sigma-54-dependent Fis family transcriptional regulator n=1 Tax=Mucilaginibacter sp. SJ TaxID=3029053 RepID=UPI0023A974F3|nr:sigma 54-interacting transcriptional regulator [Mucilaginibacter sp. SJ]WEA01798.1 sigma 54-interacting transcriptional regulator [Mucilaginibacter sp. SJ]
MITSAELPVKDGLFDMVLEKGCPEIIDVEKEYLKGPDNHPRYIPMHYESGIKELLAAPLYNEQGSFGMIVFYGDKKKQFRNIDKELISGIVGLVAIAAWNVLANEEIATRDRERDILLSLSSKMARIRDKEELLGLINSEMKELFYFTHCSISKVSEDRQTFTVFLTDPGSPSRGHQSFHKMIATQFPVNDGIFEHFLRTDIPIINSVEEVISRETYPLYSQIHYQSGLREAVSIPLQDENDTWGVLHFYSDKLKTFSPSQFHTFTIVANQVTVAVLNIMANEDIRKREAEKNNMLMVAEKVGKIRDKNDLAGFLADDLRSVLYYATASVIAFTEDLSGFQFYITDPLARTTVYRSRQTRAVKPMLPVEGIYFERLSRTREPIVIDLAKAGSSEIVPEHILAFQESGQQEAIIVPLYGERYVWGALFLTSEVAGTFTPEYARTISGIANQVSVAISNINANADISLRKQEKENLLTVSHELGTVRQFNELLQLLNTRLKHLFYFTNCLVSVSQDEGRTFTCYSIDAKDNEMALLPDLRTQIVPASDDFFSKLIHDQSPQMVDSGAHIKQMGLLCGLEKGNIERISIMLYNEKGFFGVLSFFSDVKNCFNDTNIDMITGVGSQVAIALSNIIANEEIKQSEREKSMLLSFSYELAEAHEMADLKRVLSHYLKEVFQIREFTLSVLSDDKRSHSYFMYDVSPQYEQSDAFQSIKDKTFAVEGALAGVILASDQPVTFDIEKTLAEGKVSYVTGRNWLEMGAKEVLGVPLRAGNENIGILWTQPHLLAVRMIMGLGAQIAIALSNALAMEKNRKQLAEIQKYKQQLEEENLYLQEEIVGSQGNDIIGSGDEMKKVYHLLSQVAPTGSTVLILGETGTGKELIARAIHNGSPRKEKLMVKVNCAALPANLIESELFGHEKGSFTGAIERRIGKFELANRSTLFLDEVGELPLDLQAKLLRVLQEKEIERLGGKETLKVDVRIIAATNRNLQKEVEAGRFRSDLFYRLNVVPISLPALRERKEDIPVLVTHFIGRYAKNAGKKISNISHKVLDDLMAYNWPGNVRELEHLIERSVLLTNGTTIREMHLPVKERAEKSGQHVNDYRIRTIAENERDHILNVLQRCGGKVSGPGGAAELLGVPHSTLTSKMAKLGIKKAHIIHGNDQ